MKNFKVYFELAARIHVFIILNMYGSGKIAGGQFHRFGKLPPEVAEQTLGNVNTYDLGWTFMGHSYLYILFVGLSQMIGGWLLLWNRTKYLGIAMLMPVLLNIIVFDIIYLPTKGALASATLYFLLLVCVLIINKNQTLNVLKAMTNTKAYTPLVSNELETDQKISRIKKVVIAFLIFLVMFGVDQALVNLIGH